MCVPVFPGKAGTMPCPTTIFSTAAASRSLLRLWLTGAHYSKGCPLPEGLTTERERRENKTKVTCPVLCSRLTAVWFTLTLHSVTCLIGAYGQTQEKAFILVSPDLFLLQGPAGGCQTPASTNVKVFSRCPGETKKNLYHCLISIFVHLAQRELPVYH